MSSTDHEQSSPSPTASWCPRCGGTFDLITSALVAPTSRDAEDRRCALCVEAADAEARSPQPHLIVPSDLGSGLMRLSDVFGIHAVDVACSTRLRIRLPGEGDLERGPGPGPGPGPEDRFNAPAVVERHDDLDPVAWRVAELSSFDVDDDDGDDDDDDDDDDEDGSASPASGSRPFIARVDVLLLRIDGVLHAIWGSPMFRVTLVARVDSPWWPFRRDGEVADLALGPSRLSHSICNFFSRPPSDDAFHVLVAVAEYGPAAGAIVIEAGIEWLSREGAPLTTLLPISSGVPLEAGSSHRVSCRPQEAMRARRIVISDPGRWFVDDIQVGGRSLLVGPGLPGEVFSSSVVDSMMLGVIGAGVDLSIDVALVEDRVGASDPLVFNGAVIGESLSPRVQRYPHFFSRLTPEGRHEAWLAPEDPGERGDPSGSAS